MNFLPNVLNSPMICVDGQWVSSQHERIARTINEYDSSLHLAWIPPDRRVAGENPFAVICTPPNGQPYCLMTAQDCDERLLARIFMGDTARNPNLLKQIEMEEAAREAIKLQEHQDYLEAQTDFMAHVFASPKSRYRHNGRVYE
jgi:hypothetical protein